MGIPRRHSGTDLTCGPLIVRELSGAPPAEIAVTPRIAVRRCAAWPLRFHIAASRFASR